MEPKLLDRETLKHLLAMTIAGRIKRSVSNQALDPLFKTPAFKKKLKEMTKGNKKTAEWLLYAAGAVVNVFVPEDTPVKRLANEIFSDTLAESGQRVAETSSLVKTREVFKENEGTTVLGKVLEINTEQLEKLVDWLDSLEKVETDRFFEEVKALSILELSKLLELDGNLRTKLLYIVSPSTPVNKNVFREILFRESEELKESFRSFNQRIADKRQKIRVRRQERRARQW